MALTVSFRITGDAKGAVTAAEQTSDAFRDMKQAADQAAVTARATAMGLGDVEMKARAAASATLEYGGQFRSMGSAIDEAEGHLARFNQAIADEAARLAQARASLNPYVAAQQQYVTRLNEITTALKAQDIGEIEAQRARDLARASYARQLTTLRQVTAATREQTGALKLQGYQTANLAQQLQDVVVQLGSGANPAIVLLQQGPQITSAVGGVKNALALVKPYISVTTVSIAGLTTALAVGAAAWSSYLASTKEVSAAAAGLGRGLGATAGDLDNIARSGAAAAGISIKSAREAEVAFLRTGQIGADMYLGLIALSRNYAATMGSDLGSAIDDLAQKFADPAKAVDELTRNTNFLDDRTAQYIRTLANANQTEQARLALFEALQPRLVEAGNNLTWLGRRWNDVKVAASDAFDRMGEGVDRLFTATPPSQQYLDELEKARERAQQSFSGKALLDGVGILDLKEFDAEIARVRAGLAQAAVDERTRQVNLRSTQAGDAARLLDPGYQQLETLRKQQAQLRAALHDPEIAGGVADLKQVAAAYDRVTHALDTYLTPAQRAAEADRLATAALKARTPAEKAAIAEQQKRLELAGQTVTSFEAETQAISAGTVARAQATQAIADQNRDLTTNARETLLVANAYLESGQAAQAAQAHREALSEALRSGADATHQARLRLQELVAAEAESGGQAVNQVNEQADAQKKLNDAVLSGRMTAAQATAQAQLDAALKPLLIARANAEGEAKATLTRIIDALTAAYGRLNVEQQRGAASDIIASQNDELETINREISLVGQSAQARQVSLAVLQAEQQARRAGIDLGSEEMVQIRANAAEIARRDLALQRSQQVYSDFGDIASNAFDDVGNALAEGKSAWSDYESIAVDVLRSIEKEIFALAVKAPILNSLFGTNYATLGDAGGLLGSLLGNGGGSSYSLPSTFEAGFTNAVVAHTGWLVGAPVNDNRIVPSRLFDNAPRRHSGGLAADEVPIIAKRREEILTEDDPRHIFNIGKSGGQGGLTVYNNIQTAPGLEARTSTRRDQNGDVHLDTFVYQLEDKLGARAAMGQGSLVNGMGRAFNADPSVGRRRPR